MTLLPVAIDAMGGDKAPAEIVEGARRARDELAVPVVLVGIPDQMGDVGDLDVIACTEAIPMDADPARSVRTMKDSSLVRAAEAVRDGRASAMVSAGNTGATMGAALLRMGRTKGVNRPAIATPVPNLVSEHPTLLVDAGANAECQPEWLVQFAQMGSAYATSRFGIASPRVGLLSIGEEPTKGTTLVKETHALLAAGEWRLDSDATFVGNVEGRDLMGGEVDVVVTDGFTGNVALKTLEGAMRALVDGIFAAFDADDESRAAAKALAPALLPLYAKLDPDSIGGAVLLGLDGVCVISHGSSSATAIVNAVKVAVDAVEGDAVGEIRRSIGR